jgi:hypothetical protein
MSLCPICEKVTLKANESICWRCTFSNVSELNTVQKIKTDVAWNRALFGPTYCIFFYLKTDNQYYIIYAN